MHLPFASVYNKTGMNMDMDNSDLFYYAPLVKFQVSASNLLGESPALLWCLSVNRSRASGSAFHVKALNNLARSWTFTGSPRLLRSSCRLTM